ncbi:MAG: YkgJ family cysteine cluster protein [Desulfurococcaceae archaeon]
MKRFECLRCDECCTFRGEREWPVVLAHEVELLRSLAKIVGLELNFVPLAWPFLSWKIEGTCPFYDPQRKACTIHELKPIACKMFPLLLDMGSMTLYASGACKWVRDNADVIGSIVDERDIERIFPLEYGGLKELLIVHEAYRRCEPVVVALWRKGPGHFRCSEACRRCVVAREGEVEVAGGVSGAVVVGCTAEEVRTSLGNVDLVSIAEVRGCGTNSSG